MDHNFMTIDETDRRIIEILQAEARTPNAEIARQIGMAPSAIHERIRKLEERGIIEGYVAKIHPRALGAGLLAFVFVHSSERIGAPQTAKALADIPEVLEVHHVAGEDCFLVKVRTADTNALGELLNSRFGEIHTIDSTRTTIVLGTVKETTRIPTVLAVEELAHG
jgi:Lrp/AsnC family transcriptional regulator, leucine-responsive regulatory protein